MAVGTSKRTLGDIVDDNTTLLTNAPFDPDGFERTTESITAVILASNASSPKESFPAGICKSAVLSTLNSTRPSLASRIVFVTSEVIVPALGLGIKPLGPSFLPSRPTLPITSGVAMGKV